MYRLYRYRNFGSVISLILPAPWGRLADIHVLPSHAYPFSQAVGVRCILSQPMPIHVPNLHVQAQRGGFALPWRVEEKGCALR